MDQNEEYHDPDYLDIPVQEREEVPKLSEDQKIEKIKSIIRREFSNELSARENEVMQIEQRLTTSRRIMHRLRYALVTNYYCDQKLQLTNGQIDDDVAAQNEPKARAEVTALLRDSQRDIHPSVRKLLGKKTVDINEIFMARPLRNKARKDYLKMASIRNYTIGADSTVSMRPDHKVEIEPEACTSRPRKVPRHREPRVENVLTLDDPTRNKMKHRYRLIVGNTSKYSPGASAADRSTHQWLLYVRGPPRKPDPSPVLRRLVARLHASYAPHHTVHVSKAPFHISRRGWGEFPARVELHFPAPEVNRPAALDHTIKLDRNYTGLQTLGAETVVDVWLYSTPEMLEFEYCDPVPEPLAAPDEDQVSEETQSDEQTDCAIEQRNDKSYMDNWNEFFNKDMTELNVDEMIIKPAKKVEEIPPVKIKQEPTVLNVKTEPVDESCENGTTNETLYPALPIKKRIMKYIDATTGKIVYLEMDRNLDLTKVQEAVMDNSVTVKISPIKSNGLKTFRKGVSLLKPEIKSELGKGRIKDFSHIENDHCYLETNWSIVQNPERLVLADDSFSGAKEKEIFGGLCSAASNFKCVRTAVGYMLKRLPIITPSAEEPEYLRYFPFAVGSEEKFWKLDFVKRRNIEWTRAKIINSILLEHFKQPGSVWRTKQILVYSRLHGYNPVRSEYIHQQPQPADWSSWEDMEMSRKSESNIKEVYPNPADICSLTVFDSEEYLKNTSDTNVSTDHSSDNDEVVDVVCCDKSVKVVQDVAPDICDSSLTVLPVEDEEDRLRFLYIERKCADIGVELRNEDVGNGYSYSAVHAVLLSAMKSYAEELIRCSLAEKLSEDLPEDSLPPVWTGRAGRSSVFGAHVFAALARARRLASGSAALGVPAQHTARL